MVQNSEQGPRAPTTTQKPDQHPMNAPRLQSESTVTTHGSFAYHTAYIGQGFMGTTMLQPTYNTQQPVCPYHYRTLQMHPPNQQSEAMSPMERFLAETGSAEQSSLLVRPDTGLLSTARECTCNVATNEEFAG